MHAQLPVIVETTSTPWIFVLFFHFFPCDFFDSYAWGKIKKAGRIYRKPLLYQGCIFFFFGHSFFFSKNYIAARCFLLQKYSIFGDSILIPIPGSCSGNQGPEHPLTMQNFSVCAHKDLCTFLGF